MKDILIIIGTLLFAIALVIFAPLATIWALNTVFPLLAIPFTFYTWLAVVVLNITMLGSVRKG